MNEFILPLCFGGGAFCVWLCYVSITEITKNTRPLYSGRVFAYIRILFGEHCSGEVSLACVGEESYDSLALVLGTLCKLNCCIKCCA